MPRGLDLLPSMRAPRRIPRPASAISNGGGGTAATSGDKTAGMIEYVPWVGGTTADLGGADKTGQAGGATESSGPALDELKERVQWFPRGLPKEATPPGRGQDERESAVLNTRASMAIDRLGEQVEENKKRQAELEVKRRQKVGGVDAPKRCTLEGLPFLRPCPWGDEPVGIGAQAFCQKLWGEYGESVSFEIRGT